MTSEWYIEQDGKTYGPYALADMFTFREQGRISESALLLSGNMRVNWDTLQRAWADPRAPAVVPLAETAASPAVGAAAPDPLVEFLCAADPTPVSAPAPPVPAVASPTVVQLPAAPQTSVAHAPVPVPVATPAPREPQLPRIAVERDSILILGRRRAGKTVYLATLYAMHWKTIGGLTMKALAGPAHKMLMGIMEQLQQGAWPEATLGTRQLEFELDDDGRRCLLVAFDYSGEDFSRAFVDEDQDSPNVRKLLNYLDRAAAVILLIDPAVAVHGASRHVADDDFGMVQAVERIRNWPGGDQVPVVLALTKADRSRKLIQETGTLRDFVVRHYPALVRTLGRITIFAVSAVQQKRNESGKAIPAPDSVPINVDKPLRYCLDKIREQESLKEEEARQRAGAEAQARYVQQLKAAARGTNRRVAVVVTVMLILGLGACALIWILKAG